MKKNIIKAAIAIDADINVVDKYGQTPLLFACTKPRYETIEILLNNG